ncbi:transposase [Burkholderia ubonensis]|uniref:transposase n=1 Tax=Burkholderia ubonensis TaxID=101571 RepID=UPI0009B3D2B0|nr:transposase [Burkholderia ubonensis]
MFNERGQVHVNEQEDGLQSRLVVNRKRDGRRKFDEVAKRELIEACLKPGVSITRTAMEHGTNPNLVRTRISKYQREQGGARDGRPDTRTVSRDSHISAAIPPNARNVSGLVSNIPSSNGTATTNIAGSAVPIGAQQFQGAVNASFSFNSSFIRIPIVTSQTIY